MTQIDYLIINDMTKLGSLVVGKKNQITIMGILNISPESFYKNSIKSSNQNRVIQNGKRRYYGIYTISPLRWHLRI